MIERFLDAALNCLGQIPAVDTDDHPLTGDIGVEVDFPRVFDLAKKLDPPAQDALAPTLARMRGLSRAQATLGREAIALAELLEDQASRLRGREPVQPLTRPEPTASRPGALPGESVPTADTSDSPRKPRPAFETLSSAELLKRIRSHLPRLDHPQLALCAHILGSLGMPAD